MDHVKCHSCDNEVTPRLWHSNMNSFLFNRYNQHICPICGCTIYTTGGGVNILFLRFLIALIPTIILGAIFGEIGFLIAIAFFIGLWAYSSNKKKGLFSSKNKKAKHNPWLDN